MFKDIIKCTQYDLLRAKAKAGQMYFVTDSRVLYKDNGNSTAQRLRFNAVILHTDAERLNSIKPTIGKFYYVEETNSLWLFDTRWVLKIGNTMAYNTYYAGDYVSPVINVETSISGPTGDVIIDNNGLLGDGSVVIRDINRITRAVEKSNLTYNRIELKSYLDDGFLFIPNAHLPYNDLSTSLGALHLTVEKNEINNATNLDLNGAAHYYGTWNNYGNMYLIQKDNDGIIPADYVPINEYELVKFYITSIKQGDEGLITNHIIIRPVSDSLAIFQIVSILDENSSSVVQNDMGELIFTNSGAVIENVMYECTRRIMTNDDEYKCEYILDTHGVIITISQSKNSMLYDATLPSMWTDNNEANSIRSDKWIKDKVLTNSEIDTTESYIKRIT